MRKRISTMLVATAAVLMIGGCAKDDNGSIEALAKEFKGQRWDADRSVWK